MRIGERAMGDAAMNVAASSGGSGGQRIVKEGWLQKRGTAKAVHNIYTLRNVYLRLHSRLSHAASCVVSRERMSREG